MSEKELENLLNEFSKNFLTLKDIANKLQVKERTVWQYKSNGFLPAPFGFIDNKPIYSLASINDWLKSTKFIPKT